MNDRYHLSLRQLHQAERADPLSYEVHFDSSYVLFAAGRHKEASRHCDKLPPDAPDKDWCSGRLRLEEGRIEESIQIFESVAGLRDKDRTFQALDRSAVAGPFRLGRALAFPEFAFLRGDRRLNAIRKKVGLPE